ncbi:MAG TPA: FAD-dependent oxidoreductase [Candidatus Eisenbacteria bacterium]|nr:FAD-dependent oxidoreductase [Candidatus Eisenbacteria bacterium]
MSGPALPRLVQALPATADVAIVGGGVIGAATAFFAARAGLTAVVIERRPALGTLSTSAATGAFRLQFDNPDELALVREGVALYARFAEAAGLPGWDLGLHAQGYLWCARTPATVERQRAIVERQRGWGLDDVELLPGDEARRRFPYLAPDVQQARWRAGDGWLDPRRLTAGYAAASGAPCVVGTEVTGLLRAGERVTGVRTSRGDLHAAAVVIAAGPFSGIVAAQAGLALDIRPVRRMRLALPDVPEAPAWAPMTIDEETGAHWRPWAGGAHCMWTQPDSPAETPLDDVPGSDAFAFAVLDPASPASVARLSPFWAGVWARQSAAWLVRAGQYDETPDRRPLLGATPVPGLHLNTGYSGHGIMGSAGGSRLCVDALTGRLHPAENPFRLDRDMAPREHDVL